MNEHDKKHLKRLEAIARMVERIYDAAAEDAAAIGAVAVRLGADGEEPFSFDDYPQTKRRMDELLSWLREQLEVVVGSGVAGEWLLSEDKNDELVRRVLGATGTDSSDLPEAVRRRLFDRNEKGCEAFLKRKEHGLGLSERVWRATESVPGEMAMGIDMGIREGKPAAAMARDLKQYLKHPDKLFRRVRDERGILHLSKNAAAFHPGRGVYRSSYQNARRLAVTEVNTAYRTADHERWQQLDFVVGVEVHLSGNHTCKGRDGKPHKFEDICDQLAGKYPKDFKFTGWHPHCRCYATSILKTDEEIAEDTRKMLRGEPTDGESVNKVEDVPGNFKEWVEKNEARIATARESGTLPGFVRENEGKSFYKEKGHKYGKDKRPNINVGLKYSQLELFEEATNNEPIPLTPRQIENKNELAEKLKLGKDKISDYMTHEEADSGKANQGQKQVGGYENCSITVIAYEARRRGLDVTAHVFNYEKDSWCYKIGKDEYEYIGWEKVKKERVKKIKIIKGVAVPKDIESATKNIGRYHFSWDYEKGYGHVITAERLRSGELVIYDPQDDTYWELSNFKGIKKGSFKVLRVDNLLFNVDVVSKIIRPLS